MNPPNYLRLGLVITLFAALLPPLQAQLITYQITVQPIRVSNGTSTANSGNIFNEAAADRIFAQAGVDVKFLSPVTYTNPSFYSGVDPSGANITSLLNSWNSATGNANNKSFLRLFFIDSFSGGVNGSSVVGSYVPFTDFFGSFTQPAQATYGYAVAVSTSALGSLDVIAHEIGHALSFDGNHTLLDPYVGSNNYPLEPPADQNLTPQPASNLMADGLVRTIPSSVSQIYNPVLGGTVDRLDSDQIARISNMYNAPGDSGNGIGSIAYLQPLPLNQQYDYSAVPEPEAVALAAGVLAMTGTVVARRRRQASRN